jgi:hypothetical protein
MSWLLISNMRARSRARTDHPRRSSDRHLGGDPSTNSTTPPQTSSTTSAARPLDLVHPLGDHPA